MGLCISNESKETQQSLSAKKIRKSSYSGYTQYNQYIKYQQKKREQKRQRIKKKNSVFLPVPTLDEIQNSTMLKRRATSSKTSKDSASSSSTAPSSMFSEVSTVGFRPKNESCCRKSSAPTFPLTIC